MKITIIADAVSNLYKSIIKEKGLDIRVLNQHLRVGDKEFFVYQDIDNVNVFSKDYYQKMASGVEIKTSLVSPGEYEEAFLEEVKKGNKVICFTMAQGISGTYNSACLARDMVNENYPEKMVEVIDSMTAGFGEGLQAIHAYELVKEGKSFDDIIKECEEFKHFVRSDFVVDDVRYLIKTGRVSKTVARFVRFLNIKAILKRNEASKIALGGTALGKAKAIKALSKIVIENINSDIEQTVYITHCDCLSDAEELKNKLLEANIKNIEIYDYDVISAAHIGPNSLAVFYVAKEAY